MSWVAEKNAISQKHTSVAEKNSDVGSRNATAAIEMVSAACMASTHHRLVLIMSTNGLQNGFITQGR